VLLSALPALAYIGLVVYAVIDCLQTPIDEIPRLSRSGWIAVIVLIPLIGALSWLFAGQSQGRRVVGRRHERAPAGPERTFGYGWTAEGVAQHPIGPDDDPEFMASLNRAQAEHQRLLTRQEEDRLRRERESHHREEPPQI
jgi:hypothetical protein